MATGKPLRLVIVTPEKTLLDETVSALRFPLYDGDIGILPGRLPLIGRLGSGELKVTLDSGERRFFIDGGFVQVKQGVVTLLTNSAVPAADVSATKAEEALKTASAMVPTTEDQFRAKAASQNRARKMLAVARKPR
ncbi:MAG: ATP synthase F1 subunit epsilon [Planctomycetaceae bacterium]|nr:ATP synthase F1 subunit epsilon [Planctomycetaceae bacterium]